MEIDIENADQVQIRNLTNNLSSDEDVFIDDDHSDCEESLSGSAQSTEAEEICDNEVLQDLSILSNITGTLELQNYSETQTTLNPNGPFATVKDAHGKEFVVRKSSICWLLNSNVAKLSSDRLQRVRTAETAKSIRNNETPITINCIRISDEINIGDWCLFEKVDDDKCVIGIVLSFAYINGKTWKSIEYSSTFARVSGNTKSIGVLCHWFNVDSSGKLVLLEISVHGYIPIEQYRLTIPSPTITEIGLNLSADVYIKIKDRL